ncbi:hypothetical protein TU78_22250, partial [Pseudomonas taetrolens]
VLDAGASITLMAGGQHIVISAAGIYSSSPIVPGGVPVPGTPAMPLVPGTVAGLGLSDPLFAPPVPYLLERQRQTMLKQHAICAICEEAAQQKGSAND